MKRFTKLSLGILVLSAASLSVAKPRHIDDGTTIVTRTAYGVGELAVDDSRILDLTGDYTLTDGTSASVTLSIVQDARGKLAGSFSLADSEGTAGPFPAVGSLAVQRHQPLKFEFKGRSRNGGPNRIDMRARGVFNGEEFVTVLRLKNRSNESLSTVTLVPVNPARGALVSDGQGYAPRPGTVLSTRTVTLPWGERVLPALERTHRHSTHFVINSNGRRKGNPLGRPLPFGMRVHGATDSAGDFHTMLSHIRLGYGHLDSATSTTVTKSAFTPISVWEGTDTTSEPTEVETETETE